MNQHISNYRKIQNIFTLREGELDDNEESEEDVSDETDDSD